MIFSIADFFIRRPVFSTVCSLIISFLGIGCIANLPSAQYPQITPPQVNVVSNYVGASAEVVEETVTNILERAVNGLDGVRYVSSSSANDGTSNIVLTFEPNRSQDLAAVDVQNRVSTVLSRLPAPVQQTGVTVSKENSGFVFAMGLFSENGTDGKPLYDEVFLSNYADLYLVDAIRRVKGVANVQIFGERNYAMRLWLDPNRLAARGLTAQDVVNAVREQNLQVGAGQIGQQPAPIDHAYQLTIKAQGRLREPEEFGNIVIRTSANGDLIKVKDVGRVELGAENYNSVLRFRIRDAQTNEFLGGRSVGLGITQLATGDALKIADEVQKIMRELEPSFPPGLKYDFAYDTTAFIRAGLTEVVGSLLTAVGLVIIILFLFLQDWRTTLVPALAIPVSLLGTFIFVKALNFNINTLTLFGLTLAAGMVVDDAIVIVEDISRRIRDEGRKPLEAAIESMNDLFSAVIATSLVLIAIFVPVAFFPGTTGQLYQQFALTIAFSIVISTFNAVTFTPSMAALLFRSGLGWDNPFFRWINRGIEGMRVAYRKSLFGITRLKGLVLALFVASLGLTYWMLATVPTGFLPGEDQGYFITLVQAPEGVSLNYTEKVLEKVEAVMLKQPEVRGVFAIGGFSFSGSSPNQGLIFTTLKPWDDRKQPNQSQNSLLFGRIYPELAKINDARVIAFPPPAILGLGSVGGFEFQLQSLENNSFDEIGAVLGKFLQQAASNPSLDPKTIRPDFNANTPQLTVEVDRDKSIALRVSPQEIFNALQTLFGSTYVNDFDQFGRSYRVYVQADIPFRTNPEDINKIYVRSETGEMLSLQNLVTVQKTIGPAIINHYNLYRSVQISGSPGGGASSGQAIQAMTATAKAVLPKGFSFEWTGLSLEEISAGGQGILIFAFGLIFVFLVLAAQYENYIDPFIIMLAVPPAILGALLTVTGRGFLTILPFIPGLGWLRVVVGAPFEGVNDVYTQIGFLMLIGLASKNSILIVEFANQLRQEKYMSIAKAAIEASQLRLRPILMTTISSLVGTIPLLVATGAGAAARQSLGTAVVGGTVVAASLSLFITPVLYIMVKIAEERIQKGLYQPKAPALPAIGNDAPSIDPPGETIN